MFDDDPGRTLCIIVGADQELYWRRCMVKVYETDEYGDRHFKKEYDVCDGKGSVPKGTEIYLGGILGIWKEI